MLLGAVLYTLAINHKHMLLYFAPAFFSTMLGGSFAQRRDGPSASYGGSYQISRGVLRTLALGAVVIATCLAVWAPFLKSIDVAKQVCESIWN